MLAPDYLSGAPSGLIDLFGELEEYIIRDIARRVAKTGAITDTALWQTARLQELGAGLAEIDREVARILNRSEDGIEKLLNEAVNRSLGYDDDIYRRAGLNPDALGTSQYIRNYITAVSRQTQSMFVNFTQSMGFKTPTGFKPMAQYYQHALDLAHLKIASGAIDYRTAIRQAVAELADSGIRGVDYESGWVNRVDVAVRRAVLTGIGHTAGELAIMRADALGVTTMEITAHAGARPSHAVWQGRIVDRSGRDPHYLTLMDIGYGDVTGFKGANCRHDWFPFVPGISVRTYTDSQLRNIDPPPFEYNGKTYSYYDATQYQRRMETAIRKTKREIMAYDAAGDSDMFTAKSVLLRRQRDAYNEFCRAAGIRPKLDRAQQYGYGRSISQKAVWAYNRASSYSRLKGTKTAGGILVGGVSNHFGQRAITRGIGLSDILDALTKPLKIGNIKEQDIRRSQEYFGENARVQINPDTGVLITVWKTSRKLRIKLKGGK